MKKLLLTIISVLVLTNVALADTKYPVQWGLPSGEERYIDITYKGKKVYVGEPIIFVIQELGHPDKSSIDGSNENPLIKFVYDKIKLTIQGGVVNCIIVTK